MILRALLALLLAVTPAAAKPGLFFTQGAYLTFYEFRNGTSDPRITYAGGQNGTAGSNTGNVAAKSAPRFTYGAVAPFAPLGIPAEPTATNLSYPSQGGAANNQNTTVTNGFSVNVDGTLTSQSIADNATNGTHIAYVGNSISYTSGVSYSTTINIKAGTAYLVQISFSGIAFGTNQYANYDLSAGTLTASAGGVATAPILGANGFWKLTFTATATATASASAMLVTLINNPTASRNPSYVGSGQNVVFGSAQTEVSPATSYIPSVSAAVTRSADAITIPIPANVGHEFCTLSDGTTANYTVTPGTNYTLPTVVGKAYSYCGGRT